MSEVKCCDYCGDVINDTAALSCIGCSDLYLCVECFNRHSGYCQECEKLNDDYDNEIKCSGCQSLQSELSALKESTRWIPVEERLPKVLYDTDVWVIINGLTGPEASPYTKYAVLNYRPGRKDFIRWDKDSESEIFSWTSNKRRFDQVTHWMLPKERNA